MNKKQNRLISLLVFTVLFITGCVTMDFNRARSMDTILSYKSFLMKHPQGKYSDQARIRIEELEWEKATSGNTISFYENYLVKHPQGKYSDQARIRIEELEWERTQSVDAIVAYEKFLQKHPQGKYSGQARIRLEELERKWEKLYWERAKSENKIEAYEMFLQDYPHGKYSDQARLLVEAMRLTLPEWEKALKTNTIKSYAKFLTKHPDSPFADKAKRKIVDLRWKMAIKTNTIKSYSKFLTKHPDGPFADKARGKIVDLEVSDIMSKSHGNLPSPKRMNGSGYSKYAVINIYNDTKYNLTVRYSGPNSFKVIFSPREKGSIEAINGNYRVAASVDAAHVKNYAGEQTLKGGNYEVEYYIVTSGPFSYTPPRISLPRFSKFEAWPNRRRLPKYLK